MSQPIDKPFTMEPTSEIAVNKPEVNKPEESKQEEHIGPKKAAPTVEPQEREPVVAKTFYCNCRDCKLYFGKGNPIECVNPNIVELRYPKWKFSNNSGANKVPVFRRPADPETRKDVEKVKRRKR